MEKLGKGETVLNTFVSTEGIAEKRKKNPELLKLKKTKRIIWVAVILCCNFYNQENIAWYFAKNK